MKNQNKTRSQQRKRTLKKTRATERGSQDRANSPAQQLASGGTTTGLQASVAGVNPSEPSVDAHQIASDEPNALALAVREIATERKATIFEKKRRVADLVESEFKSRGEFYRSHDGLQYFLPNSERRLLELGRPEFAHLLADVSGLSQTETQFRFVFDRLSGLARRALPHEIHTLSNYDERTGILAVSDGGIGIWIRERGGCWQRALNGENGIMFRTDLDADPWEPEFTSSPDGGQLEQLNWFMQQFPFVPYNEVSPEVQRTLLRFSLFHRFFPPLARTILIPTFIGPSGSGKSTAQRLIGRLLVGLHFQLSDLNAESFDGFVAAITNHVVFGVDNVDARVRWFQDAIARYATGIRFLKRRAHSQNDAVSHSPIALLTLSSCNPYFTRADVAARLLPLHFGRLERFRPEGGIFGDLEQRRNAIMGDVLRELGNIQDRLATTLHIVDEFRMADFASFMQRAAADPSVAHGQLNSLRRLQLDFASDCDDLIEVFRLLLELKFGDGGVPLTPVGVLYGQCVEMARYAHLRLPPTLQGFGQRLSNEKLTIESRLNVKFSELRAHGNQRKVELKLNASGLKKKPWPPNPAVKMVKQVMQKRGGARFFDGDPEGS